MSTTRTRTMADIIRSGRGASRGASQRSHPPAPGAQYTRDELAVGERPAQADGSLESTVTEEAQIETTGTEHREALWSGYCSFALDLRRRDDLTDFRDHLRNGRCPDVEAPQLMEAAIEFVTRRGKVRPRMWLPAPTDGELDDLQGWITQRLAEERAEKETAERRKHWQKRLARELGKNAGEAQTGTGRRTGPVYQQRSKYELAELARRLEWTIAQHQAQRGKFERTWLDARSPHYIHDGDGGIGVKGIIFMANAIVGRQEPREYDENWAIVMNWLREQQASRNKPERQEP